MTTSNYRAAGDRPNAVAISKGKPGAFKGRKCKALEPTAEQRKLKGEAFAESYRASLAQLNAREIFEELGEDSILLCWEKPGDFCHRQLVAAWLQQELGIEVSELAVPQPATPVIPLSFYGPKKPR